MERKQLFNEFMKEYEEWTETGKKPKSCIQDAAYQLEIQKKRLDYHGIKMICKLKPYKGDIIEFRVNGTNSRLYSETQSVERDLTFIKDGKTLYHKKNDQLFSQKIIENPQGELAQLENFECPNCGSICQVKQLLEGCSYCGTKFMMQDLYPTVNNFGFIRTDSSETSVKKDKHTILITQILLFPIILIAYIFIGLNENADITKMIIPMVIGAIISDLLCGWIIGRYIFIFIYFISHLTETEEPFGPLSVCKTHKIVTNFINKYDPNFQYDAFEGNIIALLKVCILTDNLKEISRYEGPERAPYFENYIDIIYNGHMLLRNSVIVNNKCRLDLRAFLINKIYKDGEVISVGQKLDFTVERDLNVKTELDFKIHAVTCTSCGASFDAAHQKTCPHCKTPNNIKEQDWVITKMDIVE